MNLYFRLLWIVLHALKRPLITESNLANEIHTRVMPNDLDINLHMNNGRYLTICDFTRVDLFVRSGLARLMLKNGWNPVVAEHTMTYIKPLNVFDKIKVTMSISHSDEKYFYCQHKFFRHDKLVAEGTSKALVISKSGRLEPAYILAQVRQYQSSRAL